MAVEFSTDEALAVAQAISAPLAKAPPSRLGSEERARLVPAPPAVCGRSPVRAWLARVVSFIVQQRGGLLPGLCILGAHDERARMLLAAELKIAVVTAPPEPADRKNYLLITDSAEPSHALGYIAYCVILTPAELPDNGLAGELGAVGLSRVSIEGPPAAPASAITSYDPVRVHRRLRAWALEACWRTYTASADGTAGTDVPYLDHCGLCAAEVHAWSLHCGDKWAEALRRVARALGPGLVPVSPEGWLGEHTPAEAKLIEEVVAADVSTAPAFTLAPTAARLPYRKYRHPLAESGAVLHVGQRKLLISELAVLQRHARPGDTVVYAGAAPGTHIGYLAELYPALKFVLYDPREFAKSLAKCANVATHQEFFTDETARTYADRDDVIFVSDIRNMEGIARAMSVNDLPAADKIVAADMAMQERWVDLIAPRVYSLKFRLPWGGGQVTYLAGDVWPQPWAPRGSTESRLVGVRDRATRRPLRASYDARLYEEQMFYVNAILRPWARYRHGIDSTAVPGLDHCYDCAYEANVWRRFHGGEEDWVAPERVAESMRKVSRWIGRDLTEHAHGVLPDTPAALKTVHLTALQCALAAAPPSPAVRRLLPPSRRDEEDGTGPAAPARRRAKPARHDGSRRR